MKKNMGSFFFEVVERFFAAVFLVALMPLFVVVALLIRRVSPGPALFFQTRIGKNGRLFTLVKFRTMHNDVSANDLRWCSGSSDTRVFGLGRFLRSTRIDELPQLWNIVRGELAFVGPRPERPELHAMLAEKIAGFEKRLQVTPGITGVAQLVIGYTASVEEARWKLHYDLEYIREASESPFLTRAQILLATFGLFLKSVLESLRPLLSRLHSAKRSAPRCGAGACGHCTAKAVVVENGYVRKLYPELLRPAPCSFNA